MFSAHSRLRHAVADTFAMVVYCTVVNMMIEIFLSGMTFEQSLSSRLGGDPGQHYYCRTLWGLSRFRHASGPAHQPSQVDEKYGRRAGLRHLSVAGVCRYSVERGC